MMSLPDGVPSTLPVPGAILDPDGLGSVGAEDWEKGGVAVQDASQGLMSHTWRIYVSALDVMLQRNGEAATVLFQQSGIIEIALAFDQNMRPVVAYRTSNNFTFLRWYDSAAQVYTTDTFSDIRNARLTLDDKRAASTDFSDVIFAYLRGTSLCYRQQRDRYTVEYVLSAGLPSNTKLRSVGMADNLRLQFELI